MTRRQPHSGRPPARAPTSSAAPAPTRESAGSAGPARSASPAAAEAGGRARSWLAPALLTAVVLAAYHNSFTGPFIFDDLDSIAGNPSIRRLWPPGWLSGTSRPLVMLTLAANHALGGLDVRGYHAFNLAIHLASALTLLAILRRTFASPRLASRYAGAANGLALAAAALWAAHPLATQAVTYVIQRAESLAALLYLVTLYATLRGASSARRAGAWYALAAVACALGAAAKPLVVSAPIVVLLYDRFFLADSLRAALRARGALHAALAASWAVAIGLAAAAPDTAAGPHLVTVTPLAYAATQPGVILHYLRLAFWPHPLVLDYGWPLARSASEVALPALALAAVAGATLREAARLRPAGFLGLWFLLVLAPSSSFFPILDPAFEHRMYLPLAAPVVLAVVAGHEILARRLALPRVAAGVAILAVGAACALTLRRNHDYRSEIAMWTDVVARRPRNARGHNNLGRAMLRVRDPEGAMPHLRNSVLLDPNYPEARNNLGAALAERGRLEEAMIEFRIAIGLAPRFADARENLARALMRQSRHVEAMVEYLELTRLRPSNAAAWDGLGNARVGLGRLEEAVAAYRQALRLEPGLPQVHNNLGVALARLGRPDEATEHFREALRLRPDFDAARQNLERALRRR